MIRDDIVSLISRRLGERTDLNDDIILELQLGQSTRLETTGHIVPWFLWTEYSQEITDVEENRLALPEDFISEIEGFKLWVYDPVAAKWVKLRKIDEEVLEGLNATSSLPKYYSYEGGDHFTLGPTPDLNYNIRFRYAAHQEALSSNIENSWAKYAPDLLIADVGEILAGTLLRNARLKEEFSAGKVAAWDRLWRLTEARKHMNREYMLGDDYAD